MDKQFIDKLAYIYLVDDKVLVTLSHGKDAWYIPGGKREAGESDEAALVREIKEELTVDLLPDTIEYYGTFEAQAHGKPEGTMVRMTCYRAEFEGVMEPSNEIDKIDFFDHSRKLETSPVNHLIFDDLYEKGLIT
ncbi:MAG TPA: NUDIX domain-containing protein [Patescibacteria group bacterium]